MTSWTAIQQERPATTYTNTAGDDLDPATARSTALNASTLCLLCIQQGPCDRADPSSPRTRFLTQPTSQYDELVLRVPNPPSHLRQLLHTTTASTYISPTYLPRTDRNRLSRPPQVELEPRFRKAQTVVLEVRYRRAKGRLVDALCNAPATARMLTSTTQRESCRPLTSAKFEAATPAPRLSPSGLANGPFSSSPLSPAFT